MLIVNNLSVEHGGIQLFWNGRGFRVANELKTFPFRDGRRQVHFQCKRAPGNLRALAQKPIGMGEGLNVPLERHAPEIFGEHGSWCNYMEQEGLTPRQRLWRVRRRCGLLAGIDTPTHRPLFADCSALPRTIDTETRWAQPAPCRRLGSRHEGEEDALALLIRRSTADVTAETLIAAVLAHHVALETKFRV
jgi:hypothetical protein